MGIKSKPGDGIFGKGVRGKSPKFRQLFEDKRDTPSASSKSLLQSVRKMILSLRLRTT